MIAQVISQEIPHIQHILFDKYGKVIKINYYSTHHICFSISIDMEHRNFYFAFGYYILLDDTTTITHKSSQNTKYIDQNVNKYLCNSYYYN